MCDIWEFPDSMKYPVRKENQKKDKKTGEIVRELADGAEEIWFVFQDAISGDFYRVLMIKKIP